MKRAPAPACLPISIALVAVVRCVDRRRAHRARAIDRDRTEMHPIVGSRALRRLQRFADRFEVRAHDLAAGNSIARIDRDIDLDGNIAHRLQTLERDRGRMKIQNRARIRSRPTRRELGTQTRFDLSEWLGRKRTRIPDET